MPKVECILIDDCLAMKKMGKGKPKRKPFKRGTKVIGTVTNLALTPESQVAALKTSDGYIIPEPFLNIIGEVKSNKKASTEVFTDAEIVEDEKQNSIGNAFKKIKKGGVLANTKTRSKYAINFAMAGAGIGFVWAMYRGQGKLLYSALGAIAGGVIGNYAAKTLEDDE